MNDNLKLIEQAYHLKLSDEQIKILTCGFQQPTLVNSCAGAGKTTLLMLSIIYNALNKQMPTDAVIGVTFSKKAQLDMKERYKSFIRQLAPFADEVNMWKQPEMVTFHALFYHILQAYDASGRRVKVANWHKHAYDLYKVIQHPNESLNMFDDLERYMDLRSSLINQGLSLDGITANGRSSKVQLILANSSYNGMSALLHNFGYNDDFADDYIRVINAYNQTKRESHTLDYDDMQTMTLNLLLTKPQFKEVAQNYVAGYHQVYLDEFQDISFLQWEIITHLFPADVLERLVVIGDDDQSIYSFRGSTPKYIQHFATDLMPNAQVLNLSTNYRTGGRILQAVVPEITKNVNRLQKPLNAYNQNGKISVITRRHKSLTFADPALDKVIKSYHQSQAAQDGQTFALLVRYNNDLALVADYLAEHQIYVNIGVNKTFKLLQENKIYLAITNLMDAFYHDDLHKLAENANYIGFSRYRRFVQENQSQYQSINDFIDNASVDRSNWQLNQAHSKVISLMTTLNGLIGNQSPEGQKVLLQTLFDSVKDITSTYFEYVISHRYVAYSKQDYESIVQYVQHLIYNKASYDAFTANEIFKESKIDQAGKQADMSFQAMTLHSAKGLEFDNVILFGLSDRDLNVETMSLYHQFLPNMTLNQFGKRVLTAQHPLIMLGQFAHNGVTGIKRLAELTFYVQSDQNRVLKQLHSLTIKDLGRIEAQNGVLNQQTAMMMRVLHDTPELLNLLYHQVMAVSEFVEEERRLLYVGVTRAKKELIIDETIDGNSPLLSELKINNNETLDDLF